MSTAVTRDSCNWQWHSRVTAAEIYNNNFGFLHAKPTERRGAPPNRATVVRWYLTPDERTSQDEFVAQPRAQNFSP